MRSLPLLLCAASRPAPSPPRRRRPPPPPPASPAPLDAQRPARPPRVPGRRCARGPRPRHARRRHRRQIHRDPVRAPRPRARWRQRHLLPARADHLAHPRADPRGGRRDRPTRLAWKNDFVMWSMRNDSLVNVRGRRRSSSGYGIVAPEQGWNDYEGLDAKGKIVVVLVNDPGLQDSTIFRGKILTYYGRWTYKIEEARRQGAAGILIVHTDRERDLSLDHGPLRVGRAAGAARDAAELPHRGRLAAPGCRRAPLPAGWPGSRARCPQAAARRGFKAGAARASARRRGPEHDSPLRDRERARPLAGAGRAGAGGGAHRRPLRPLRNRRPGRRRLDLQRRRGQRLRHGGRPGHGRGLRPERRPRRALAGLRRASRPRNPGLLGSQALATTPPFPLRTWRPS